MVFVVLMIARRAGSRLAGSVAGLPTTVAPALLLLAAGNAPDYAIRASIAAMWASAAYATFALCYARLCPHLKVLPTTTIAISTSVGIAILFSALPLSRTESLFGTILFCAAVRYFLPALRAINAADVSASAAPPKPLSVTQVAMIAGAVSMSVYVVSGFVPAYIVGMIAAAPIIGATVAAVAHHANGPRASQSLMAGYVDGCIAKIVFCFVFATLLRSHGVAISLIAAIILCAATSILLYGLSELSDARAASAAVAAAAAAVAEDSRIEPEEPATIIANVRALRDVTITIPVRMTSHGIGALKS